MKPAELAEKHYKIELTRLEELHLAVHIEEESTLSLWGDVKGVWDGYKTDEGGFGYIVKPEDDRPEVHDAIYNKIKAILEERMASYYEELMSLPEKALEIAKHQDMDAPQAADWVLSFIANGGTPEGEGFDEALAAFFKNTIERRDEDGHVMLETAHILVKDDMDAAEWDDAQRLACLVRFAEAGGPKNPSDWRVEVSRHVNREVVADLEAREAAAPKL
jgi:hypothetical protein